LLCLAACVSWWRSLVVRGARRRGRMLRRGGAASAMDVEDDNQAHVEELAIRLLVFGPGVRVRLFKMPQAHTNVYIAKGDAKKLRSALGLFGYHVKNFPRRIRDQKPFLNMFRAGQPPVVSNLEFFPLFAIGKVLKSDSLSAKGLSSNERKLDAAALEALSKLNTACVRQTWNQGAGNADLDFGLELTAPVTRLPLPLGRLCKWVKLPKHLPQGKTTVAQAKATMMA